MREDVSSMSWDTAWPSTSRDRAPCGNMQIYNSDKEQSNQIKGQQTYKQKINTGIMCWISMTKDCCLYTMFVWVTSFMFLKSREALNGGCGKVNLKISF
jgi:hypothetical protein